MPKIVDHDERRAHIVEAVTQIIIRDGFDRVTMREIAAEAGYAHGAIARYFPDKQALLTAAFLQVFNSSHDRTLQEIEGVRGLDALRRMSRVLLPYSDVGINKSRIVLSFWDRAAQDQGLWEIHHENIMRRRQFIRRFLTEAMEDGELAAHVNIEVAVEEVSARNAGWQMLAVLVPEAATNAKLDASLDALIRSFRAPIPESL
ncbi:TetR/AcrR family transcriptional regulator [Leucobacter luti]|uniref:TetR family transcriptional regulator n=1 Tax=Leucobacter luti TaxID=340320 RepID=A0A4R6RX13_9MICO|nr:TetR/AcrR family transcriptional regulator [Leucobacter luti]MCW2288264.1 AcrR family transcriptional regulator [Leucobacter luti]QYM75781.1 TetR/AcrR family transcriptional regulator [Leucobacter luti]TCK45578.1 TetR family transcriptional regulator [Leucobacter luti]TDP91513.1 TetR family transcriptional regulator [Leucobacter luti]